MCLHFFLKKPKSTFFTREQGNKIENKFQYSYIKFCLGKALLVYHTAYNIFIGAVILFFLIMKMTLLLIYLWVSICLVMALNVVLYIIKKRKAKRQTRISKETNEDGSQQSNKERKQRDQSRSKQRIETKKPIKKIFEET